MTLLASLEDFQISQGHTVDPTNVPDRIALEGASDAVRTYCERTFAYVAEDEETLEGTGTRTLVLRGFPVHDVTGVIEIDSADEETAVDVTEYLIDGPAGLVKKRRIMGLVSSRTWPRWKLYRVSYSHGYVLPGDDPVVGVPELPHDLRGAVMEIAASVVATNSSGGQTVESKQLGSFRVAYAEAAQVVMSSLGPDTLAVLDRYRAPRRP